MNNNRILLSACVLSRNNDVTPILRYTLEIWAKFYASYLVALRLESVARVAGVGHGNCCSAAHCVVGNRLLENELKGTKFP